MQRCEPLRRMTAMTATATIPMTPTRRSARVGNAGNEPRLGVLGIAKTLDHLLD